MTCQVHSIMTSMAVTATTDFSCYHKPLFLGHTQCAQHCAGLLSHDLIQSLQPSSARGVRAPLLLMRLREPLGHLPRVMQLGSRNAVIPTLICLTLDPVSSSQLGGLVLRARAQLSRSSLCRLAASSQAGKDHGASSSNSELKGPMSRRGTRSL